MTERAGSRVVMIVQNPFRPDVRVLNEARALQDLGMEVEVLAVREDPELPAEESVHGVPVHRVELSTDPWTYEFVSPLFHVVTARRLAKAALALEGDIHHGHDLPGLAAAAWLKRWTGKPVVFDAHEVDYASMHGKKRSRLPGFLRAWMGAAGERFYPRFADRVVVPNEMVREAKPWRDVHVVPYRPPPDLFGPDRRDAAVEDRFEAGTTLVYHGGLSARKGLHELLGALARLDDEVRLLVVGHLRVGEPIGTILDRHGVAADRFDHVPWVPYDELAAYLNAADVGVVPIPPDVETYSLAIPNKLYDLLACGLPVVASDLSGMARIVEEVGCGEVFRPFSSEALADAVRRLLAGDLEEAGRRGLAASRERFPFTDTVEGLRGAYEGLGSSRQPNP